MRNRVVTPVWWCVARPKGALHHTVSTIEMTKTPWPLASNASIYLDCPVMSCPPKNMLPTATSWMVLFCSDISCGPFPAFSALSSRSDQLRRDENHSMHAWPGCWMMAGMSTTSQLCLNMGAMYTPQPPQLSPFHGHGDHPMNPLRCGHQIHASGCGESWPRLRGNQSNWPCGEFLAMDHEEALRMQCFDTFSYYIILYDSIWYYIMLLYVIILYIYNILYYLICSYMILYDLIWHYMV